MSPTETITLIDHLDFILTVDRDDAVITDGAIAIEQGRLAFVGSSADADGYRSRSDVEVIDGSGRGAIPGFVDSHVHLSETLSRAVFPDQLDTRTWVFHWAKPFYGHVDEDDERVSALVGMAEMLRCGTTCFLDMGAQNDPGVIAQAVEVIGMRGITGRHAADQKPTKIPDGWSQEMVDHHFFPDAETALEVLESCVQKWDGYADGRVRCWVNIEGKEPCSLELHVGSRALAERLGVGTTYHIASSKEETEIAVRRNGTTPVGRIADAGGLGPNLVLAHAVAVSDDDVSRIAAADTAVAFCPGTSLKLAKGATAFGKYPEMLDAGVRVGLGTDGVAASGNLNLMRQLYLVSGLFKDGRSDATLIGAQKALRMATIEGAAALNWDDEIGSLERGKRADLVLFDLTHPEWVTFSDPVQALAWSASSASIAETWVDGVPLYRDGRVTTIDEAPLYEDAKRRARQIADRAGLIGANVPLTTNLYQ
jgi:5-methylthioadenosine/S-adenosylhomocysteine deaminase